MKINELSDEIKNFPLHECTPSDDPDKKVAYIYNFLDIANRFIGKVKRINNLDLKSEIASINLDINTITEAYTLKSNLINLIDYMKELSEDPNINLNITSSISPEMANRLLSSISDNLVSESAHNLPRICKNYGLSDGEVSEAFGSKRNYVYARTSHLNPSEILDLALKMQYKYSNSEFDDLIEKTQTNCDKLNVISEFENIKHLLQTELKQAKYTIWVAVAWFTDRDLANLLYTKRKEGVNIQIIINDDEINNKISEKLKKYFETYLAPNNKKLMHNKFCIIDFKKVLHGSYNWTNKAKYNDETISLIDSRATAEDFADKFIKLKKELMNIDI